MHQLPILICLHVHVLCARQSILDKRKAASKRQPKMKLLSWRSDTFLEGHYYFILWLKSDTEPHVLKPHWTSSLQPPGLGILWHWTFITIYKLYLWYAQYTCTVTYNLPAANPRQNATSAIAYTLPYTAMCLRSTKYPIVGIIEESTIPIASPKHRLGAIKCPRFFENGI